IFLVAFSTWGIYLIVRSLPTEALAKVGQKSKVKSPFSYLMGGLLLGLAILIKPVAIAEASLCILWVITSLKPKRVRIALGCLAAGLITPLAAASLYFLSHGTFSDFIYANLKYNLKYSAANGFPLEQDLLLNILRICSLITVVYLGFRNKKSPKSLVLTWFFLDLLVISLSMRPYIHYLIQAFPPLTLLTVLLISKLKPFDLTKTFATITTQFSSYCLLTASYLLLILIPLNQELEITNNIPYQFNQFAYHTNFIKFALGKIPESEYVQFFEHNTVTNSKIASFVKEYSNRYPFQSTQVLIWGGGEAPWLYYELGQLGLTPATRFTNYFHIESTSGGYQEIVEILKETPPQIFVIFPDTPACPQLTEIVEHFYEKIEEVDGVYIYKKSESRITN
ncbi:hypothetical protein KJ596_04745, partial [Patescibacteria group bacterium]|nr:hypothetical protein [Patescibacteria group bacterium]